MRMVTAMLPASLWLLLIARSFDRASVEGAMTIAGWALLGAGPAALLVRHGFRCTATAVGLVCIVILPGAWWSLQVDLPEPRPFSGTVRGARPPVPPGASPPRTVHRTEPTSRVYKGTRWLVPVPDTRIPDGFLLGAAQASWYGAWSLGALLHGSAPFLAPAVTLVWLVGRRRGTRRRVRGTGDRPCRFGITPPPILPHAAEAARGGTQG